MFSIIKSFEEKGICYTFVAERRNKSNMSKKYRETENEPLKVAEPATIYADHSNCQTIFKGVSHRESVMASTVSVDEYFDQLIAQVHKDYANL